MDVLTLSRWQFAITTIYHFFFVPLTLGLSILVAIMESKYVSSGDEIYKKMAKFWGRLFLINFAMGVVTGIVQEFQFGMNWAEYSRFMGDIFGVPLAIEALLAFYLESTMLGVWTFGWNKLSKKTHALTIWLVAIGSNLSALWILIANSFMQEPVGYKLEEGRVLLTSFKAIFTNPNVWVQFPHVLTAGITTAGFFVLSFSAYHLLKGTKEVEFFKRSFKWGAVYGLIGVILVIIIGHIQGQHLTKTQPTKMAAAEALWETEDPASFSLFAIIDTKNQRNPVDIKIPGFLSFLVYNKFSGEVKGIKDLQREYEAKYGPGNYIPPVKTCYWSFRLMVGLGFLMLIIALIALPYAKRDPSQIPRGFLKLAVWSVFFPYLANTFGWMLTEFGRNPWIVFGLLKIQDAVSPNLSAGSVLFTLVLFTVVYGLLMVADVYLLVKYGLKQGPEGATQEGY